MKKVKYLPKDIDTYNKEYDYDLIECLAGYSLNFEPEIKDVKDDENRGFFQDSEAYAYGKVIAYHYYEQYLNNQEQTKKNILDLMLNTSNYNRHHLLNNYGLQEKQITNPKILIQNLDYTLKDNH